MESKEKRIKVVFDVVNSVKGGSGKSTISLLLASYFASQKNTVSYIIDLDLRGTSWENNYKQYLKHEDGESVAADENDTGRKIIYINDLMNDFSRYKDRGFFVKLKTEYENSVPVSDEQDERGTVYLCVGQPSASEDIDDLKTDLFENAVFHIIDHIYERHCQSDGTTKEIHIILDMPPSYESHAERILRCLLSGVESQLYKNIKKNIKSADEGGKYAAFAPYVVNLYMISLWSPAHIELNIGYIKNLFNKQVYASALNELVRGDRVRFCVRFVGNDATNAIPDLGLPDSGKQASNAIATYIMDHFTSSELAGYDASMYGDRFLDAISSFPVVEHMPFLYNKDFFSNPRSTTKGNVVPLPAKAYDEITGVIQKSLK